MFACGKLLPRWECATAKSAGRNNRSSTFFKECKVMHQIFLMAALCGNLCPSSYAYDKIPSIRLYRLCIQSEIYFVAKGFFR